MKQETDRQDTPQNGAGPALLAPEQVAQVFERFKAANPAPKPELTAPNAYCFLVSVVLSAQATDKSVNLATEPLYKAVQTPRQMLDLGAERLMGYIRTVGLYRTKAAHIIALSQKLLDDFGGTVPATRKELMLLPGVGRKTANVVLNVIYGQPTMPVDTHILRISPRIGLATGTTPEQVEQELLTRIPARYMDNAHHWLILHGRYTCTARSPQCDACIIRDLCLHNGVTQ